MPSLIGFRSVTIVNRNKQLTIPARKSLILLIKIVLYLQQIYAGACSWPPALCAAMRSISGPEVSCVILRNDQRNRGCGALGRRNHEGD
jgi:hypothetical protein